MLRRATGAGHEEDYATPFRFSEPKMGDLRLKERYNRKIWSMAGLAGSRSPASARHLQVTSPAPTAGNGRLRDRAGRPGVSRDLPLVSPTCCPHESASNREVFHNPGPRTGRVCVAKRNFHLHSEGGRAQLGASGENIRAISAGISFSMGRPRGAEGQLAAMSPKSNRTSDSGRAAFSSLPFMPTL